jgi:hypothetical protein
VVAELRAALAQLAQEDASLHAERIEELLYVSNVLVAASRGRERQLRPPEAMDAAIATAAFGLDLALRSAGSRGGRAEAAVQAVRATPIERLFAAGFRAIHEAATAGPADRALIDELRAVLEPA